MLHRQKVEECPKNTTRSGTKD